MARPIFIMMVGVPGSGKSTRAKELAVEFEAEIFSSDEIRAELYGDASDQTDHAKVFRLLESRLLDCLKRGKSAIYDATNISSKHRAHFVRTVRSVSDAYCRCEIVATEPAICHGRNLERDRVVPAEVIDRMIKNFQVVTPAEDWDVVEIYRSGIFSIDKYASEVWTMDQMNSHHSLCLGEHMMRTWLYIAEREVPRDLILSAAAGLHDIGKPHCMTFTKPDGTLDHEAHYYGHENAGAYLALCDQFWGRHGVAFSLGLARYIQYHMLPYTAPKSADLEEWLMGVLGRKGFDEDFVRGIMILHEADRAAH